MTVPERPWWPRPAPDLPVELSPEAPHRLRRAEDRAEQEIRERVFQVWLESIAHESPRRALFTALDEYRRELTLQAIKRLGMGATR